MALASIILSRTHLRTTSSFSIGDMNTILLPSLIRVGAEDCKQRVLAVGRSNAEVPVPGSYPLPKPVTG